MSRWTSAATRPRTARRRPAPAPARRSRSCRWSALHAAPASTTWKIPASLRRRSGFNRRTDAGDEVVDELALPLVVTQGRVHDLLRQRERQLADLAAQRHQDLLPLRRKPVLEHLDLLLAVGGRLCARLLEDLAALGLGLFAEPGDLAPVLGERVLVLLTRLLRFLASVLRVLELLADGLLPLLDQRADPRDHLPGKEDQDQDEDDPLEDERPVG